jgi:3-phosphoshikimate 1-carboxyvinyltransferase
MKIRRANALHGVIAVPGDKSISHRAAMLAAIATGETRIANFAPGQDCRSTLDCLTAMGVPVRHEGSDVIVQGVGKTGLLPPSHPLDCGNSGTTMRLLAGILAGQNFRSVLTGDESLRKRPMGRVIDPLTTMGAAIGSEDGRAPLAITGKPPLKAIEYRTPVASAQIKSCVLLAGLYADGDTIVIEPTPTRDHTERMLEWLGVKVKVDGTRISVSGGASLTARDILVPGDISGATFFMVAAACLDGSGITLGNVGLNPLRSAICDVLQEAGADIQMSEIADVCNEPVATIRVRGGLKDGKPVVINGARVAGLIDEVPILSVLGTRLANGIEIRDARELRVKESDRIAAIVENLKRMGGAVTEFDDGFRVQQCELKGATVDSFGDHRIAMAFAVAGLLATGETEINDADCADVSFPGFFEILGRVAS